ncbi:MaoC/PaaZ C-terminal domain-containing protein [Corynebacterium sputi]|uniref:MaoC/PaaZ C-terminal domain-containing protein n=1 Tax=Corynebacterium sputi TaxID=489915 RepID=UPI00040D0A2E|nr:MaoC/PaaZ C-terminal domain-containing protein [Corynebacterium sputi]
MKTVTLPEVPSLAPLYGKAAAGASKKRPSSIEIEVNAFTVKDVPVTRAQDEKFRALVGGEQKSDEAFFGHIHSLIMPLQLQLMGADDFPLPMMGLVHTDNSYRQLKPIAVDSTVDLEVRVSGFREHRVGTEILLDAVVSQNGEVAVEERSVYLARGRRLKDAEAAESKDREKFKVPAPTAIWRLPAGIGRKWAKVSGDWNPIHITGLSAKALGMPGAIAHGMYTASRALAEADARGSFEFDIAFGAPVVLPATVPVAITRLSGESSASNDRDIVAWDKKKRRPHFTASVRDL